MALVSSESVKALYDHVCESYHGIDDLRMKLLGLLPVATGTGVFLLLSGKAELIDGNSTGQAPEGSRRDWYIRCSIHVGSFHL